MVSLIESELQTQQWMEENIRDLFQIYPDIDITNIEEILYYLNLHHPD
jgi:pyrroloquinoline quinone (PQQ) biosynthesis protein C